MAPAEAPAIVVSVLIENGGHGSEAAAPIARRLMDLHLAAEPPPDTRYAGGR
jgi:penicillin-binding protein 2